MQYCKAKELVNGEPFAVVLPDRIMDASKFNPKKDNLCLHEKTLSKI